MAMINISFDTVSKEMKTTINGQEIDACYASFYSDKYEGEVRNSVSVELRPHKNDGMYTTMRVCAANEVQEKDIVGYASEDKTLVKVEDKTKINTSFKNWLCDKN